jgi:pyruvate/2-oxoglutarate dehydrogenase complex dihydrolipoamide acyltransferase (E2) component
MTDIAIPRDLWQEDIEGVLVAWLVDEGDHVEAGAAVAEIMVEKAQYEIIAPASGTLRQRVAVDGPVRRGDSIGRLET